MAGKRRDFDGQFAVAEIGFWLNDPRVIGTTATFKVYLHYSWMLAVKERRETLPSWYNPRIIGHLAGLDPKTSEKNDRLAREKSLHGLTPDGRLIIYGVKSKHPNLKWKDGDKSEDMRAQIAPQKESESETQTESEVKETKTPSPNKQFLVDDWEKVHKLLSGINAKNYRTLKFDKKWIEGLERAAGELGGRSVVLAEAGKFAIWMEGQFDCGKERRDKNHNVRSRFLNNWLGNAIKYRIVGRERWAEEIAADLLERNANRGREIS